MLIPDEKRTEDSHTEEISSVHVGSKGNGLFFQKLDKELFDKINQIQHTFQKKKKRDACLSSKPTPSCIYYIMHPTFEL